MRTRARYGSISKHAGGLESRGFEVNEALPEMGNKQSSSESKFSAHHNQWGKHLRVVPILRTALVPGDYDGMKIKPEKTAPATIRTSKPVNRYERAPKKNVVFKTDHSL
jgi:hypothetical protein